MFFYAVRVGRTPGVYRSWNDCAKQVHKFPKAAYKKFHTMCEAEDFIDHPTHSYEDSKKKISTLQRSKIHSSARPELPSCSKIHSQGAGASAYPELQDRPNKPKSIPKRKVMRPDPPPLPGCGAYVYTDGSCLSNGITSDARAGMGVYWGEDSDDNVSRRLEIGEQTNSRAELIAIRIALDQAIHKGIRCLEVRSDSNYAIKSCSKWLKKWSTNGWKLADKKEVCHKDVLMEIQQSITRYDNIQWTHIPAHKGYFGNEMADKLAKMGAAK